ncbi:MAG: aldo/keto reductase [Cyclobacteriaceae bacterium]
MNNRLFRGIQISEIGLGTWQLGSADWGHVDQEKAQSILSAYINKGGNFIDTADVYGMGNSERTIGAFLKNIKSPVYVASKLGRRHDGNHGWPQNFSLEAMRKFTEETLRNLNLNSLFLQQLHCIPFEILKEKKVFEHLKTLNSEGLIQHWGVSVETSEEALFCLEQEGLASLQIIFNMFRQQVADEVFAKAQERNVALIIRVPLASGLLTGKFNVETVFESSDHRNYNANGEAFNVGETFSGIPFQKGVELSKELGQLLPEGNMAPWALRWILDHKEVTTVIPGASSVNQVDSNVSASHLSTLPTDTHQKLRALFDEKIKPAIRGRF